MAFHRYVTPTYPSPPAFDLINVTSGGTGGGGSANADGAKIGGPNVGTFFVAFGEDSTSSNANRGLRALAQNTDALDDLFNRPIAVPVRTVDATAVGAVANVTLPVATFLGVAGTPNTPAGLNLLYEVVDSNDNEIIDPSTGVKVKVNTLTLGAGDVVGGGGANGSFSGNTVQLNFSPSIPNASVYRIYYGTRSSLGVMPADSLTNIRIRGAQEVEAAVEDLFRLLHGNNESWNAAWDSTIYDLAISGLNERYRRASTANPIPPDTYFSSAMNGVGAGAWISRDGPGLTVFATDQGAYLDPINGLFVAKSQDTVQAQSGGTVDFAAYGNRLSGSAAAGEKTYQPGYASLLALWSHYHTGSLHATDPHTRVPVGASVNLTTPNTNVNTGEAVVELVAAANYFRKTGTLTSSIAIGYDLVELQFTKSAVVLRQVVCIVAHGSSADAANIRKVRIRNLDGTIFDYTGSSVATIKAWHSLSFGVGDGAAAAHRQANGYAAGVSILFDGLHYQVPQRLSSTGADDNVPRTPMSVSGKGVLFTDIVFQWGGFDSTLSGPVFVGHLLGNGGINTGGAAVDFGKMTAVGTFSAATQIPAAVLARHRQTAGIKKSMVLDFPIEATESPAADVFGYRIYRHKPNGAGIDQLEIVANAKYDNTTDLWTGETTANRKSRIVWFDTAFGMQTRATGAGTFNDTSDWTDIFSWDFNNNIFDMFNFHVRWLNTTTASDGSNPASTVAVSNQLRAKNTPKCWGILSTDGAGAVDADDGFNIASLTIVSGDIEVTMASAMVSTDYIILPASHTASQPLCCVNETGKTTTKFRIRVASTSFTQVSAATTVLRIGFVVFGQQNT